MLAKQQADHSEEGCRKQITFYFITILALFKIIAVFFFLNKVISFVRKHKIILKLFTLVSTNMGT